jgi:hypothetical protein
LFGAIFFQKWKIVNSNANSSNPGNCPISISVVYMIGSIKERNSSGAAPPDPSVQGVGFPKAEHRSKKSAFLQNRQNASDSRPISAAQLTNSRLPEDKISDSYPSISLEQVTPAMNFPPNDADMISQISCENGRQVEAMREEERESKRNEVLARFGPGIAERLRKAREAQLHAAATQGNANSTEFGRLCLSVILTSLMLV